MGGNLYGADIEALRQLADRIVRGGETLDGVVGIVESAMPDAEQWSGPDAEGFRDEWYGSHGPALTATAQALAEVAETVRGNADEQDDTSGNLGGVIGGVGIGGGVGGSIGSGVVGQSAAADWRDAIPDLPDGIRDIVDLEGLTATIGGLGADALSLLGSGGWADFGEGAGKVFAVAGLVTGGYQALDSGLDFLREGGSDNLYGAGDGAVTAVLAGGTLFGGPAAPAFAIAGAVWGGASLLNGLLSDRPLTQNLIDYSPVGIIYNSFSDSDFSEDIADIADSAVDVAGDVAGSVVDAGSDLVDGAGDLLGLW
ncbi:hypothetical protein GCM10028784_10460 [Myceligenerans cantabricum]